MRGINATNIKIDRCGFTASAMVYITVRLGGLSHAIASQYAISKDNSIVHLSLQECLFANKIFLQGIKVMRPDQRH